MRMGNVASYPGHPEGTLLGWQGLCHTCFCSLEQPHPKSHSCLTPRVFITHCQGSSFSPAPHSTKVSGVVIMMRLLHLLNSIMQLLTSGKFFKVYWEETWVCIILSMSSFPWQISLKISSSCCLMSSCCKWEERVSIRKKSFWETRLSKTLYLPNGNSFLMRGWM